MWLKQYWFIFFICINLSSAANCQGPVHAFAAEQYSTTDYAILQGAVGRNKKIPPAYAKPILLALSYFPELADTHIEFRFKHTNTSFSSQPVVVSLLNGKNNRRYVVTMTDSCEKILMPLRMQDLPFNAQVGVMGHEISHIADFNNLHLLGLVHEGLGHISQRYLDRFERMTDSLCIAHGLGYQLLAWSSFIRTSMHYQNWSGSANIDKGPMTRERYMNPGTIEKQMALNPLYGNKR